MKYKTITYFSPQFISDGNDKYEELKIETRPHSRVAFISSSNGQ